MPTLDCALNSSPLSECKENRSNFLVVLVLLWTVLRALAISRMKSVFSRKKHRKGA